LNRLPVVAFATLVVATIAAFFITQHLKVTTPLIAGAPAPSPAAINPLDGTSCEGVDHRRTMISFYLLHRADHANLYVVDRVGAIVATVAVDRRMRRGVRTPDGVFVWNGREDDGRLAPDGKYYFRVVLLSQRRTIDLSNVPVTVMTVRPHPIVTSVSPSVISHRGARVTIHYAGNQARGGTVLIYRMGLHGGPRLVKTFLTPWKGDTAVWDGKIHGRPAPAGSYLIGLEVTDAACNTGRFPTTMPPPPALIARLGVTVLAGRA
jgi:hypothetical protein